MTRDDLVAVTLARYNEPMWGTRKLGTGRYALDFGKTSIIIELWFIR